MDIWVFFKEGRIRYKGGGGYGDVNLDYFGSGSISFNRPVELNTRASMISQSLSFMVKDSPFFVGVSQRYIDAEISPASLGDLEEILPPDVSDELRGLIRGTLSFVGSGKATNITSDFSASPSHSSQGLGFRYHIARRYGFDMGVDIAKGPENYVFYITTGSAWGG